MITINKVNVVLKKKQVPYGLNVTLPLDIDTGKCEEFFGTRCPHNIHVTERRKAHRDRFDPRYYPIQHLERDVGIPFPLVTLSAGTLIGAVADEKDRVRGAVAGGLIGLAIGLIIEFLIG